jgi:hypothetical protein
MREIPDQGLYVEGQRDLEDSEVAREAWRSMKNDAVSLSFGYVTLKTRKRGGINDLLELDLFEVSIVPHPANPDTRVLSMKTAAAEGRVPTDADLRRQAKALGLEPPAHAQAATPPLRGDRILEHALGWEPPPKVTPEPTKSVPTAAQQRRQYDRLRLELLTDDLDLEAIEGHAKTRPPIRRRATRAGQGARPPRPTAAQGNQRKVPRRHVRPADGPMTASGEGLATTEGRGRNCQLLRQPHGLEGFGLLRELIHADDLAVAEREDVVEPGVDLNPASPATSSEADSHDNAVAHVGELLGNQLVVVPFALPTRGAGPNRIMPLRRRLLHRVPNDAGIGVPQHLVEVVDNEEPAHDLHILQRHRPPSIPRLRKCTGAHVRTRLTPGEGQRQP